MQKNLTIPIIIVSVAVPLAVAILILVPSSHVHYGFNTSSLPLFHAILNSTTAILLLSSLYFIRHGRILAHKTANLTAVALSAIFLISYVIYHSSNPAVLYGDLNHDGVLSTEEKAAAGPIRYVYYVILISHIVLSAVIIPFVLFTLTRAFQGRFDKHKKLARITWPLWLYVAVSGVVVYLMVNKYY